LAALAALCTAALLTSCGTSSSPPLVVAMPALTNAPLTTPSAPTPRPQPPSARVIATRKLTALAADLPPGAISLAALNTRTGARYSWGGSHGMWTGSAYKLLVLEALLLQRGGDDWFSSSEYADITAMIEKSKNDAGYRMYLDAGGSTALTKAARTLGLRHTTIGVADPALTSMDARDGVQLLRNLVASGPLDKQSRKLVLQMMRNVQADQRWGVGVVADPGTTVANKNGWMDVGDDNDPSEDDHDRWLAVSLGIVRVHGQQLLMAIFTRHSPDRDTGIRLVERLARIIAPVVS
jgi:beta-lactamase class A